MGFVMLVGCGGWIGPTWEQFLSLSWYLTYPPQNNHFGSKWYHAAHQWQNGVNPTINWYRRLVSSSGGWRETNVAAYNIRFGCIFYITKSAATDRDGGVWRDGANNNIQKEHISWIWYMRRVLMCLLQWLAVPGLHNLHLSWKNEVPRDTSKSHKWRYLLHLWPP